MLAVVGDTVNCELLETTLLIVSVALPVLVRVRLAVPGVPPTVIALLTETDAGTEIAGAVPVPVRLTADGLPEALCAIDNEPVFAPVEVGVKVTVTVCAAAPDATVNVDGLTVN